MDAPSPVHQCSEWIQFCENSSLMHGLVAPFGWKILAQADNQTSNNRATQILAETIFAMHPENKQFSFVFYSMLHKNIREVEELSTYTDYFVVLYTGNNAYKYMMNCVNPKWSNTDIIVAINPSILLSLFEKIKSLLHACIVKTISRYKQCLDHMLFITSDGRFNFVDNNTLEAFKLDFQNALGDEFRSPVMQKPQCSQRSFILVPSQNALYAGLTVRIELDHFEDSNIRLLRTPVVASFDTFGHYLLYINVLNNEDKRIAANLIKVSVPIQNNAALFDFWQQASWRTVYEQTANIQISLPNPVLYNPYMCADLVIPKIIKIQSVFRGWLWRKHVLYNPHTEIGDKYLRKNFTKFVQ